MAGDIPLIGLGTVPKNIPVAANRIGINTRLT